MGKAPSSASLGRSGNFAEVQTLSAIVNGNLPRLVLAHPHPASVRPATLVGIEQKYSIYPIQPALIVRNGDSCGMLGTGETFAHNGFCHCPFLRPVLFLPLAPERPQRRLGTYFILPNPASR